MGLLSTDCYNFVLNSNLAVFRRSGEPIDLETHVLAATRDGFWDDSSQANIERTLDRYIRKRRTIYKAASHLWVVTPDNLSELMAEG